MRGQGGFFDVDDRLKELSAKGDDLERLNAIIDFEVFRPGLARAVPRSDGSKGGRPAFDHVLMFKVLILQAAHGLSDERAEYLIKDRLSFMRFLGLGLADAVPDANTIWTFREALTRARIDGQPAIAVLFKAYEMALTKAGFLLDSHFKCDTELRGERLDWCFEAEAFSRRCVEVPNDGVDVLVAVAAETGLAWQISPQAAVGVLDTTALPWTMRIAEEGAKPDGVLDPLMAGKLATVVVGDCLYSY